MKYATKAWAAAGTLTTLLLPSMAWAGDQPLYQPAPDWVISAPAIDPVAAAKGSPLVIFDMQERLESGKVWNYVDTAVRADT